MNPKVKRSILGLISSLLLTTGFVNAAERFDPVSSASKSTDATKTAVVAADNCGYICNFADEYVETE